MRARTIAPLIAGLVLLALVIFLIKRVADFGEFRLIRPHQPGICTPVLGVPSSEDFAIDPASGMVFISAADRRPGPSQMPEGIYSYSLQAQPVQPTLATADLDFEFHPHGLSLYLGPEDEKRLFVVNHRTDGDFIEVFGVKADALEHLQSISGAELFNLNDVAAIGPVSFYVTRDHGSRSAYGKFFEDLIGPARGSVLFYDGDRFKSVAEGLAFPNGIATRLDGEVLFVAETMSGYIRRYRITPASGELATLTPVSLEAGIDNIEVAQDGRLWVAAHPKLLTFLQYSQDPDRLSPAQVFRVRVEGPEEYEVEEIYLSDGVYLSGSSVAAQWNGFFLIGSVLDRRFLICRLDETE